VFFGGAGISTASGIPDFRGKEGLYRLKSEYGVGYEEMLSHTYYKEQPFNFFKFYKTCMIHPLAKPNAAHIALANFENNNPFKLTIVTQNIDGLHQKAGSNNVIELHGSVNRNHCEICHSFYSLKEIMNMNIVPKCPKCGGIIKPDVVLYEEPLNQDDIINATKAFSQADVVIIGGTSLNVYPAAGLVSYYRGSHIILINLEKTSQDQYAEYVFHEDITEILPKLLEEN
jgi:NAD-dependent deacetylase